MTDLQEHSRIFVARARERKAEIMAWWLWAVDMPPDSVARMNEGQWGMLAQAVGTLPPSRGTRILVYRKLLAYQEGRAFAA